jgi:ABC-2 type transport system permease protein
MSTTSPALIINQPATETAPRVLPSSREVFMSLFKADLTTQWRNRRASVMVILLPVIIVIGWKGMIGKVVDGPFVLSNAITLGLNAIGLMGYSNSIARDREKDIFQRLRVTPAPNWTIMGSRLAVQLLMITLVTAIVMIVGYQFDHIVLTPFAYFAGLLTAIVGGAVYLALGQAIVGQITNAETVQSTTRLIYIAFIMIGIFGSFKLLGNFFNKLVKYTPYGTVNAIVSGAITPSTWTSTTTMNLLITLGYTAIFAYLGIKWFKWSSRS